jgi:predicted permease
METLLQDIRYGFRMLAKSPGFTAVAVLTLALGIGANTAIFSLINAVLLKMLPVKNPGELVVVGDPGQANRRSLGTPQVAIFSYPLYRELRDGNHVFSGLLVSGNEHRLKVETDRSGEVTNDATGTLVSGNYFSVLGVNALMGRTLTPDDDRVVGGHPVAMVSYRFWKEKLSGDPGIVGQTVRLNGEPFTVVGVGPAGFFGDTVGDTQDVWIPMMMQGQIIRGREWLETYNVSWLRMIGRLKPGENIARARADLNVLFQQILNGPAKSKINSDDMEELRKSQIDVAEGGAGFSDLRPGFRDPLYLLMGMVALVLLIACVNVANLLLARAVSRKKEVAVRLSIGASRARLVRQLLTESIMLALAGGACGLLVASWGTQALLRLSLGSSGQDKVQAALDPRVLGFTAGVSLLTGVLFGLIPALRSLKFDVAPVLKESSTTQTGIAAKSSGWNWGKLLVVSQVALSVLVLFAAGLLVRSLSNLQNVDFGYNRDHLLLIRTDPLSAGYKPPKLTQFYDEVARRLANLPGVHGVTGSLNGLFSGSESDDAMKVEGYVPTRDEDRTIYMDSVGPNYFTTLGIPMILGRDIGPQDTATSPQVVVVNEAMARFYFKNANPIGKKIWADDVEHRNSPPFEIVGVAHNAQDHNLHEDVKRRFYVPIAQYPEPVSNLNFEVRTTGNPQAVAEAARKVISNFDSRVPVTRMRTLDELVDSSINSEILIAKLSSFFGILALLLACVGLYGIMSYAVSGRTREIGVRMALGASRPDVLWLVLQGAIKLIVVGVVIGIPAALAASRLIHSMLFKLTTFDPLSMLAVIILLGAVATVAGLIPARRATKVDPVVALRYE